MPLRRTILKCLLVSLALAAVAGVMAVLLPTRDVMVKVMLTGLTTAIAALLMIGLTFLLGRPSARLAGLYGMCAVLVDFVMWVALIWLEPFLSGNVDDQIAVSAVFLIVTTPPMLLFLLLLPRATSAVAGATGAAITGAALLLFNVAIWLPGNPFWSNDEWWGTAWSVFGYAPIVAMPLIGAVLHPRHWWRWGGAIAGVIAVGVLIYILWNDRSVGAITPSEQWLSIFTSLAAVAGFVNLARLPSLKPGQGWVRIGTIAAGVLTAVLINIFVLGDPWASEDLFGRLISASGIVTGCGSLAMVVLVALNRRGAIDPSTASLLEIGIICPICGQKQAMPVGPSACRKCGLRMDIRLEEPRCPQCDYLLYRLTSDHCPECGAQVRTPAPT